MTYLPASTSAFARGLHFKGFVTELSTFACRYCACHGQYGSAYHSVLFADSISDQGQSPIPSSHDNLLICLPLLLQFSKSLALDGHSDWVRSLAFTTPFPLEDSPTASTSTSSIGEYDIAPGEVLLASGSQDNYIRLWRFSRVSRAAPEASSSGSDGGLSALDELERQLSAPLAAEQGTTGELRVKAHDFAVPSDGTFSCASEAVLLGHDAWVTGLNWSPARSKSARLQLLSASADRSMILWAPEETTAIAGGSSTTSGSVWTTQQRFGEFASQTNLGFFGALWGLNASTVLASGWGGSWHVWKREDQGDAAAPTGGEKWEPQVATSGHMGQVRSVRWEPEGEYLLSTG